MREILTGHLVYVIAFAMLISRLGDIGTTFLVSPTLKLEANPIARRLGWKYTFATLALVLVPFYSIHGGVIVLTASLLAATSNASEALLARYLGEEKYAAMHRDAIQKMAILSGLSLLCLPAFFLSILGLVMFVLFPDSASGWGYDIAMGIVVFVAALIIFYPIRFTSERRARTPTDSHIAP